jgi:hypothetical protein
LPTAASSGMRISPPSQLRETQYGASLAASLASTLASFAVALSELPQARVNQSAGARSKARTRRSLVGAVAGSSQPCDAEELAPE